MAGTMHVHTITIIMLDLSKLGIDLERKKNLRTKVGNELTTITTHKSQINLRTSVCTSVIGLNI